MASYDINFVDITLLLKAPSKDAVSKTCHEAFLYSGRRNIPESVLSQVAKLFEVDQKGARKLLTSLGGLLKTAVFQSSSQPADIINLFPNDFHKSLRELIAKIILENLSGWRTQAINNQVSLPRMVDFDWRVDIKTSSDSIARMSVPTCILQMKVQENPTHSSVVPDISSVNVELSKETLDTMLDGLSKIRDQLSSVADR